MSSLNFSSAPRLTYEDFAPIPESGEEESFTSDEVDAFLASKTPLAFFRKKRGMSQDTLAKRAGITQSYLSEIEIGRKSGDVQTLRKLADALKVSLDSLVPAEPIEEVTQRARAKKRKKPAALNAAGSS
jgi:DNA-binding XRE family transcriptional regulator